MADENFEIRVEDKVDNSVPTKFKAIAADANKAANAIERLEKALAQVGNTSALDKLNNAVNKNATHQQRLQTEYNKTQASLHNVEAALQRRIAAEARAATAIERLSVAQNKSISSNNRTTVSALNVATASQKLQRASTLAASAQNGVATSAQRLVSEQQRTATAMAQTNVVIARQATEQQRLATETQRTLSAATNAQATQARLATAQVNTASAQQRLNTAQTQGATAAANLATAQQRTANAAIQGSVATQNLNNAQQRSAIIAQNLTTAQQRTATATSNAAAAATRAQSAALRLQQQQARLAQAGAATSTVFTGLAARLTALAGAGYGTVGVIKLADSYTTLQNKLQNVTTSQEQVNQLTSELVDLSVRTRSGLEATTTAFARFDRALKNMGKSQEDSLRLTETVNKALIVSGATTQEAQSALLQLSQAFNAGRLMGDEFRAVSENMPIVLDAIAKALGVPIMDLKKLASEGKITSKVMFDAFNQMASEIDKTFAKTTPTVAQSLVNLRTKAIEFFGELDKSYGITKRISEAISGLANNLDKAVIALVAFAAIAAIAFAPKIAAGVAAVASGVAAMSVALLANPFGAAAVAVIALTAGVMMFGDKILLGESKLYNLKDAIQAIWNIGVQAFTTLSNTVTSVFGGAINVVKQNISTIPGNFADATSTVIGLAKSAANFIIGAFIGAVKSVVVSFLHFPTSVKAAYNSIANYTADIVETVVNSWTKGFRIIAQLVGQMMPGVGEAMNAGIDAMTLKLPRLDTSGAKDAAAELELIWKEAFNTDYIGNFGDAISKEALMIANARRALVDSNNGVSLRGEGVDITNSKGGADKGGKAAEKRAAALAKVNAELDNEIARMFILQPLRAEQERFDTIQEQLIGKRITLSAAESESLRQKIHALMQAKDIQQQYDEMYERAVGPQRQYQASLSAAAKLLQQGAISQAQYAAEVTKAAIAHAKAADPMYELNQQYTEQLALLKLVGPAREAEEELIRRVNAAAEAGIPLGEEQIAQMRERISAMQSVNKEAEKQKQIYDMIASMPGGVDYDQEIENLKMYKDALMDIWNTAVKPLQEVEFKLMALNDAFANGAITVDFYKMKMAEFNIETAKLLNMLGYGNSDSMWLQAFEQIMQGFVNLAYNTSELLGNTMNTFADGLANSIGRAIVYGENLGDALRNVARSAISELISGLVKLGIQYLINQAISSSSLAASTAASAAAAAATAAAWSPAAAMASLASFGSNAAPAQAAVAGTVALTKSMSIGGFRDGGYTGNMGVNEVAGLVHGREFVMDAETTQRIGVADLQALQRGAASVQTASHSGGGSSGSGSQDTNVRIVNVIDPDMVAEYLGSDDGETKVLNIIKNNADVIKQIGRD